MTTKENSIINSNLLEEFTLEYLKEHEELINFVKNETEKQLRIGGVSQQRELLNAYDKKMANKHMFFMPTPKESKDEFLKAFNCG